MKATKQPDKKLTQDAISGASENHPVGTGVGALGGAAAGAVLGFALGPLGSITGAVVGTVAGAIAGKGIAEGINPEVEEAHWKSRFRDEPYYKSEYEYEDYGPAFRLGMQRYAPDASFASAEELMSKEWASERGTSRLEWQYAREAAKAGWDRIHHSYPKRSN